MSHRSVDAPPVSRRPSARRPRRACSWIARLAGVLLATTLLSGCQLEGQAGTSQATTPPAHTPTVMPTFTATPTAAPTFTPTPDPNANPYPPYTGTLVWNDPLSDNSQGHQWDESGGVCRFSGGAYQVIEPAHSGGGCFEEASDFSNFTLQVNMTFLQHSSTQDGGGIAFRANPSMNNYYVLALDASGSYYLGICAGTDCSRVVFQGHCQNCQFGPSQSNTLAVVANGNSFAFYVNGQQLASGTNSVYSQGVIGFFGVALNSTAIIAYQNVKVWQQ